MTQCNHEAFSFSNCRKRQVMGNFIGEPVSSNGGSLLVREVDRRMGLTTAVARALGDQRQRGKVRHDVETMVRQRVHAIALGYEDLNDHDALRDDLVVQTACERDGVLASSSTLCRFEQRAEPQWAIAIHQQLVEQFIASFTHPPEELVLDFDATDDPVHGHQPGRFFHGYYDRYCYLPLYVFCGQQLLVAYLRPSNIDASKHAWAILSLLVKRMWTPPWLASRTLNGGRVACVLCCCFSVYLVTNVPHSAVVPVNETIRDARVKETVGPWPEACLRLWEPLAVGSASRHPEGRSEA